MPIARAAITLLTIVIVIALSGLQVRADGQSSRSQLNAFVDSRLADAVLLLDRHFRVPETGQYLDAIRISKADHSKIPSSIAATGIGLVSLAIGDALGVIPDAEEKAIKTLTNLLNRDKKSGFRITRSPSGWYPHFIDPRTGKASKASANKFSTIDTALLSAGAAIAARYFSAKSFTSGRGESRVFTLAGRMVGGVRWSHAIKDVDRGLIHLVFKGGQEEPLTGAFANPFDEYALLACIAKRGEQLAGRRGKAHRLFEKHYADATALPTNEYEGHPVIGKRNGSFIAHFTHLFVYYFCDRMNSQRAFRNALREMAAADRKHFAKTGAGNFPKTLWGLGAGSEVKFKPNGEVKYTAYGVNDLEDNPYNTASPAIMAGLAAVFRRGEPGDPIVDLFSLWKGGICRYNHEGLGFLWRCSARDPSIPVARVEAVDFSTYLLGLASRHPKLGMAFFRHFNL